MHLPANTAGVLLQRTSKWLPSATSRTNSETKRRGTVMAYANDLQIGGYRSCISGNWGRLNRSTLHLCVSCSLEGASKRDTGLIPLKLKHVVPSTSPLCWYVSSISCVTQWGCVTKIRGCNYRLKNNNAVVSSLAEMTSVRFSCLSLASGQ